MNKRRGMIRLKKKYQDVFRLTKKDERRIYKIIKKVIKKHCDE